MSLIAVGGPWSRADLALVAGMVLALAGVSAWTRECKIASKWLIQACVVMLGLRLDLGVLASAALDGLGLAVGSIVGAIVAGLLLGKVLRTGREISTLVTSGTAICGGSAIVAIGMSDLQFGQWAGVALHDIASVGGAAKGYHAAGAPETALAFDTANVVKLTRVIWISPLAILAERFMRGAERAGKSAPFPWFIILFLAASGVRTLVPGFRVFEEHIAFGSGIGFQVALFLIGTGLSRSALREVGWRAIAQATALWLIVAGGSLAAILWVIA